MVAADDDGRSHPSAAHELVDRKARFGPVPVAEPADAGGQTLESDALGRQLEPALEQEVVGEKVPQRPVDRCDVLRITRQRRPAEGPDATAEERPDIGRDESRVCERLVYACLLGLPPQIVSVVENVAPLARELEQS